VRVLWALLAAAVLTLMSFYALQNGDPLYRTETEKAGYESGRASYKQKLWEAARQEAIDEVYNAPERGADYMAVKGSTVLQDGLTRKKLRDKGLDWVFMGDSYGQQMADRQIDWDATVKNMQQAAAAASRQAKAVSDEIGDRNWKKFLLHAAGAGALIGAPTAGALAGSLGLGSLGSGIAAGSVVLGAGGLGGIGILQADKAAEKGRQAQKEADQLRDSEITEGYARAREARDLARRYTEVLNSTKLDTIAKSARTSFSVPSLPKLSLNLKFAFGQARRRVSGKSEGPV